MAQDRSPLAALPKAEWDWNKARHLLFRAGFGGTKLEIDALHALGLEGAVDLLVDYESTPSGPDFAGEFPEALRRVAMVGLSREEIQKKRQTLRRKNGRLLGQLRQWWITRMARTKRPLEEKLTLFWHGHFTSGFRDVRNTLHMCQQNDLLREYASGNFAEFVHNVAKDAAMLEYLDNNRNRRGQANENFAREVMELFTLGIGNYSEEDIKEAARAFTGWTFDQSGGFVFNQRQHDFGLKNFMGKKGRLTGEDVIDTLLANDRTAVYICGKLFSYFGHRKPYPVLVQALAAELRTPRGDKKQGYELKPVLKTIFKSRAFYDEKSMGCRIKSPIELVVGAIRQLELPADKAARLGGAMAAQMGQTLFDPPNVKGWAGGREWISTSALYDRYNFAGLVTRDLSADTFRMQTPAPNEMSAEASMSSGAVGGRVRGEEFVPTSPREDSMEGMEAARADGKPDDRKARRDRSQTFRALQMRFPFPAAKMVKAKDLSQPDEIVDVLSRTFLAVNLPSTSRAELISYLNTDTFGKSSAFDIERWDASRRLKGMLHLLFSTPEYQIN